MLTIVWWNAGEGSLNKEVWRGGQSSNREVNGDNCLVERRGGGESSDKEGQWRPLFGGTPGGEV